MPIYNVSFSTDGQCASREIKAATPEKGIQKARRVDPMTLYFQPYERQPVNEILIADEHGNELASWLDDDLWLQLAAPDMLEALELCEDVLSELARSDDGTPSVSALNLARAAIAKAKGGAA